MRSYFRRCQDYFEDHFRSALGKWLDSLTEAAVEVTATDLSIELFNRDRSAATLAPGRQLPQCVELIRSKGWRMTERRTSQARLYRFERLNDG